MNYRMIEPRSMGPYLGADYKIVCYKSWENETLKYSLTRLILYISCTYFICHTLYWDFSK